MKYISKLCYSILLAGIATGAGAQTKTFTVVGDKLQYRNLATVENVTDFETFTGRTTNVAGTITFDPAKKTGSGKIIVDVASIDTGIAARDAHLRSATWLDAEKFPTMTFETTNVRHKNGDNYTVTGKLTIHGVTKSIQTNATVKFRAQGAETKSVGFDGDVVLIATNFKVKLSDYGIKIATPAVGKVANEVSVSLKAYAVAK